MEIKYNEWNVIILTETNHKFQQAFISRVERSTCTHVFSGHFHDVYEENCETEN